MNNISFEKRCAVIRCLVEGCSIRSTVRMTGIAKNTIQKLTKEIGEACLQFQDAVLRNLPCKKVQCDEISSPSLSCTTILLESTKPSAAPRR